MATALLLGAAALSLSAPTSIAYAEQQTPQGDVLVTPDSYQQYLPLTNPKDVSICDDYTAIADENKIYVYDALHAVYRTYTHLKNNEPTMNKVTKLQFADNGDLYFLDASSYLYRLTQSVLDSSTVAMDAENTGFACSTFLIEGNDLYFTNVTMSTHLSRTSLSSLNASTAVNLVDDLDTETAIAYYEGYLYYTDRNMLRHISTQADGAEDKKVCYFPENLKSIAIAADEFCLTDSDGNFYAYNLTQLAFEGQADDVTPIYADEHGGYGALTVYEDYAYVIHEQSVKQYALGERFTQMEIGGASSSEHRLNGATDSYLLGDLLYVADTGNRRISVKSLASGNTTTYATPEGATLVTANEHTFLAANETTAWLYSATGEALATYPTFNGKLVGIAAVYETYYLVTDTNYYYSISLRSVENDNGEPTTKWMLNGVQKENNKTPKLLTADVYGNLYVASSNNVYRYHEEDFLLPTEYGTEICSAIPTAAKKLLVDYRENVYALYGNVLQRFTFGDKSAEFSLGKSLTYTQTIETPVTAIAFSVMENKAYIIYEGALCVQTADLSLPTVQTIETQGVGEKIFAKETAEFSIVETAANAFMVQFDLQTTQGAACFPYQSHGRHTQPKTALKIGETDEYAVLAYFNKATHNYENYLVLKRYITQKPTEEYLKKYSPEEQSVGYLTNAVTLYKFPYLTDLLSVNRLAKNQAVTLIGEINELDYSYFEVLYKDEEGNEQIGFVPKTYVTPFDASPKPTTSTTHGDPTASQESIWRMTFLLLGTAAIGLLLDLLIFRGINKKDD